MTETHESRRRTGQTLAEFAITLPILLLLIFGIIEFGRIFQAWVTLQNAARAAARYATTGQYDTDRYQLDLNYYDPALSSWVGDINSIVPCVVNIPGNDEATRNLNWAQRGEAYTWNMPGLPGGSIQAFRGGPESIYATYYSGDDCDPADSEDQNRRKDLARLLSIYDEARRGAAGLALGSQMPPTPQVGLSNGISNDPSTWVGGPNADAVNYPAWETVPWYQVWYRPITVDDDGDAATPEQYARLRHSDEPGWFDMMICSSRPKLFEANQTARPNTSTRFDYREVAINTGIYAPACLLNEYGAAGSQYNDNSGKPWLDAGGPGDTITIVITFNHPLVTPLGLASYLPLQARRSAVNESFRSPRAVPLGYELPVPAPEGSSEPPPSGSEQPPPSGSEQPPPSGSEQPPPTSPPTPVPTATPTFTPTATSTPMFECSSVTLGEVTYFSNEVRVTITNSLPYPTVLKRVVFNWQPVEGYAGLMVLRTMYLGGASSGIWSGNDSTPPTDVGSAVSVGAGTPAPDGSPEGSFVSGANLLLPPGSITFSARFANGPVQLNAINMPRHWFNGSIFYFDDLNAVTDCAAVVNYSPPGPTDPPGPEVPTIAPPPTFACIPGAISISPPRFESLGWVRFDITNYRNIPATILGFDLKWQQKSNSVIYLSEVHGGSGTPNSSNSILMWSSGSATQDSSPPTRGMVNNQTLPGGAAEGSWQRSLTIPPGGTRSVYLQFRGVFSVLTGNPYWRTAADFYGTLFYANSVMCDTPRGPGSGTSTPEVVGVPTLIPTPTPTNTFTPRPTNTPTPVTPSKTPTPVTPSRTPTPVTPSNTPPPSDTPRPSDTPQNTNTPTLTPTETVEATATRGGAGGGSS